MTKLASLALLAATLTTTACLRDRAGGDADLAEVAADSTVAANDEGALLSSLLDGTSDTSAISADAAASVIASRAAQRYNPAGCVIVTQNGLTVTLEFAGCTGPRGLRQLDGTLVLDVSAGAGGSIVVAASAADFHIGLSTLDIAATATDTGSGATQSLDVGPHTAGVGGLGFDLEHDGDYTVTWDTNCVTLDGAWSTERGDASRSTTADITRCVGQCPVGTVTRHTVRDRQVEVTFDGTATASWTSSSGRSGTFGLACGL